MPTLTVKWCAYLRGVLLRRTLIGLTPQPFWRKGVRRVTRVSQRAASIVMDHDELTGILFARYGLNCAPCSTLRYRAEDDNGAESCSIIADLNRVAWCDKKARLSNFREIRAIHDDTFVRVYQAYNEEIASMAARANSFRAPMEAGKWSSSRMTWIKPSAVWMAYRCGWTMLKDKNQARVLALDMARPAFEELLREATLSHSKANGPGSLKDNPVVVQWDPERVMDPAQAAGKEALTRTIGQRSIQIGLRGKSVERLLDPAVVLRIVDVTDTFQLAFERLSASPPDVNAAVDALWPAQQEAVMSLSSELLSVLQMGATMDA